MIPAQRSMVELDLGELRALRSCLTDELQGVRYWRQVVRARSDLLIASLLYHGHADLDGLHGMAVAHDGAGHDGAGQGPGTGERLERLRERERELSAQQQALRNDLDAVTRELLDRVLPRQRAARQPEPMGTLRIG